MLKKKAAALLMVVPLVLASGGVDVRAQDINSTNSASDIITPFYDYISLVGASLVIGDLGRASSGGFMYYSDDYDSTLTIQLQRSNGGSWSTVQTWSKSFSGGGHHSLEEDYYVLSGNTYRVVTTATIRDGNTILEIASSVSSEVTY